MVIENFISKFRHLKQRILFHNVKEKKVIFQYKTLY